MATDRRSFLAILGASALLPAAGVLARTEAAAFLGCRKRGDGFEAAICDAAGRDLASVALPARGHGGAVSPDGKRLAVFARRPDRFAMIIDAAEPSRTRIVHPPEDRHFYGHGFFSADGRLLCATENDFERARGLLGVYDAADGFRRVGELDTHGIGPHQTLLLSDGRTAIVANGGIETHPDVPRRKLNLATMTPSLAAIDIRNGELLARAALPREMHQLSLRHITIAGGEIWFAGQYEGPAADVVPLVGVWRPGEEPRLLDAPGDFWPSMKNYAGSIAANSDGRQVAVTSPRGGVAHVWDAARREVVESRRIADVCGAAALDDGFVLSDGRGRLWCDGEMLAETPGIAWDNHLVPLAA